MRKRCDRQQASPLQARARRKARLPGSQLHTLSKMASFASTSSSRIAQVGRLALNYADIIAPVRPDIPLCACAQRVGSVSRPVTTAVPRPAAARQQQLAVQLQAAAQVRAPESSGWARRSSSSSTICGHQSCEVQGPPGRGRLTAPSQPSSQLVESDGVEARCSSNWTMAAGQRQAQQQQQQWQQQW